MNCSVEIWKPIAGTGGLYEVSTGGNVRSITHPDRHKRGRILNPRANGRGKGYLFVTLCFDGKRLNRYVHRLVAEAFIPNPENKPEVNHKNGTPSENGAENLEWATHAENTKHAYTAGLNTGNKGKKLGPYRKRGAE